MPVTFDITEPMTLRLRVPLDDSRSEDGLGRALDALVASTKDLAKTVTANKKDVKSFLWVTFHTPKKKWVSERRFFERCASFPALAPKVIAYAQHVNPTRWPQNPFRGTGFWTSAMAPTGSLALVPLALRDPKHIPALIEQMRGSDLDHETFHRSLVTELVRRHGMCDEIRELLAFRAVDGAGQNGDADLAWLVANTPFGDELRAPGGLEVFATRVHASSRRTSYRSLYVSIAGKALYPKDAARFSQWIAFFEARGLVFDPSEKTLGEARAPYAPNDFEESWEEAASCDDRDD